MTRYFLPIILLGVLVASGCFNPQIKEPLVVVGDGGSQPSSRVSDPAPGVSDSRLTKEQLYQRELSQCQSLMQVKERRINDLEDQGKDDRKRRKDEIKKYEDNIQKLEKRIGELEKENRELRRRGY
jgi:hypothetical protein